MKIHLFNDHSDTWSDAPKSSDAPKNRATYGNFVELQTAIVRAIALAWTNDEYKQYYIHNPADAIKELLPEDCPIREPHFLSIEVESSSFHDFMPEYTGGWAGNNDEVTFWLPPPPMAGATTVDRDQTAAALTAYAQILTL